jgi:DNA recombination protein RmuC
VDSTLLVVTLVISGIAALGVIAMLVMLRGKLSGGSGDLEGKLLSLTDRLDGKFSEASKERSDSLLKQAERVGQLERELATRMAALHENQKQSLTIAEELRGLQRILKTPAQRGALGEVMLETALRNVLSPNLYQMQYTFPDGVRADAIIRYEDKVIPVDAKFSLDNYNRFVEAGTDAERDSFEKATQADFKKRIDETAKYVRPEDGTFEFALMFIPSEALYYELVVRQVGVAGRERNLIEYAHEKRVVPVSPVVLYAYLQTILQGIKQIQFAKGADEIRKRVSELGTHIRSYEEQMRKVGIGIKNAASAYNTAVTEFGKIDKDVVRITGEAKEASLGGEESLS